LGDRLSRQLFPGGIKLLFSWGEVGAKVARYDFDLDAALLAITPIAPSKAMAISVGALPNKKPWPQGAQALGWHAYGYPVAHPSGMTLTGIITSPEGSVDGNPAAELFCNQGGQGYLEGSSGSPVCYGDHAFGLIRFGPPLLGQRVIHAVLVEDIAVRFPEVASLMENITMLPNTAKSEKSISFYQIKIDTLANRLALLTEEYVAANEQLNGEIDEVSRIRLRRRSGKLEEEIRQIETELDSLR
jgi:hypothetical protein